MKILCIGDSLTEGDYGIPGVRGVANVHAENYPYFLSQNTGATVVNAGKCGYTATTYLQFYKEGNVDTKDVDLILVMLGTNGGNSAKEETPGNADFRTLLSLLRKDMPGAKIFLCTPPHVTENPAYINCGYAEQVAAAGEFVRLLAREEDLPLIETALCPDFTVENEKIMQPNDGLHFTEVGYRTLAAFLEKELRRAGAL